MTPERRFWRRLSGVLPRGHWVRVENPCDPGTPDVSFRSLGVDGWMELKYCEQLPMTDKHGLRTSQKLWIKRRQREHGTGPVVLAIGTRTQYHKLGSLVFFVDGAHAQTINTWTLQDFFKSSTPFAQLSDVRAIERALILAITHFCR